MRTPYYSFNLGRQTVTVHSTNQLVMNGDVDLVGGKTGFIRSAGYCLASLLRLPQGGPQIAVVVLGARSNAGRFWETRHLFNWLETKALLLQCGHPASRIQMEVIKKGNAEKLSAGHNWYPTRIFDFCLAAESGMR